MGTEVDLAAVGKNINRAALVQQAKVNVSQARAEAAALLQTGWTAQHTDTLAAQTTALENLVAKQAAEREEARVASDMLAIALDESRTYIRKIRASLRPILRALPHGDATAATFKAGGSLGNAANVSAYLVKIRPGVEKLTTQLHSMFPGTPPVQLLDELRAKLDVASTNATLARNKLPELTQAMNEAKGTVLLGLRDLFQFAKVAFDADEPRQGKFFLDLISGHAATPQTTVTVSDPTSTPAAPVPAGAAPVSPPVVSAGGGVGVP
jgi:hypothetical protein